ncbi:acyl-CoA dehydrogenase family protein [Streptomyces sp. RS2]|uniref:acyl-CoA dehydrogenase family protein n=1 Tax=Streptomyces sp. RS2 TaxID=1451205 RepID=UPI0021F8E8FE|nr:acyl-CoA dehydrogenase family protein [Streptomyces sp. RS2]MCW1100208.1 acyl-CoA dehydrogenase family protein [Streptomyces sp. RS2]
MMRSVFTNDHEAFRESARAFVRRHLEPVHQKAVEDRGLPREAWREAGRQGFLGLGVPEEYGGGAAPDYRFSAVLTEELAGLSAAVASSFSIHYDVVAPYLVELGTDEQRERWLPGFCTGETVSAIGMTEPSGGSDLAALQTAAKRVHGKWILNGSKTFITNGASADLVVVAARTGPGERSKGISLFLVDATQAGFRRGRKLDKVGQPESDTAELFFDDIELDDSALLGEVGRGFVYMMERLPQERISGAISNIAHVRPLLQETIQYARERKAFGRSIGSFQHNKFVLAELNTKVEVTQAFVDQCLKEHAEGRLDAVTAAKAKWWTAQVQNEVIDACVQIFGGYGYMREYRIAQAWMDARVTKIWAGSNEIMKELIGRDLGL